MSLTLPGRLDAYLPLRKPKLTDAELALAIRVARVMADGPYVAEFEFLAVMGFERSEYLSLVEQLEEGARPKNEYASVIGHALLNATEFPHKKEVLLEQTLGVSIGELRLLYERWRACRRPAKVTRAWLRAGPVIIGGHCFRVIGYEGKNGHGWFCEVWVDGRWTGILEPSSPAIDPDLEALETTPIATAQEIAELGVSQCAVPPLYNWFVRGQKRRRRRAARIPSVTWQGPPPRE